MLDSRHVWSLSSKSEKSAANLQVCEVPPPLWTKRTSGADENISGESERHFSLCLVLADNRGNDGGQEMKRACLMENKACLAKCLI
jgi:hypothetical protein